MAIAGFISAATAIDIRLHKSNIGLLGDDLGQCIYLYNADCLRSRTEPYGANMGIVCSVTHGTIM